MSEMTINWNPIETCPKDGSFFMIGRSGRQAEMIVSWVNDYSDNEIPAFRQAYTGEIIRIRRGWEYWRWASLPLVA